LEHLLQLDQRLLRVPLRIRVDELELVRLARHLKAASPIDLVDGHPHALRRHPAIGVERTRLRLELADLDDVLCARCRPQRGHSHCNDGKLQHFPHVCPPMSLCRGTRGVRDPTSSPLPPPAAAARRSTYNSATSRGVLRTARDRCAR